MHRKTDKRGINTVFFDLDGTLVDTAPDLAAALNQVRSEEQLDSLPFESIRPLVSHGGNALVQLGFDASEDSPRFSYLRNRFLEIYDGLLHSDSHLFEGMDDVLATLEKNGLTWGIITNKPAWLTEPLISKLSLDERAACIVSGDTTGYRKPHPAPLLHALEITKSDARCSVYIGDAERDIAAGRAACMHTVVALYGYLAVTDDPVCWQADALINTPGEILSWLDTMNNS